MLATFIGQIFVICTIITAGLEFAGNGPGQAPAPDAPPAILERLPVEKRGALVSLSATDHYVNVVTTKGQEMILMRLADAIKETGSVEGLHVHRSHWVAIGQVQSAARSGEGASLTMSQGGIIPVSRANVASVRDAGLLPKR
jgi:DNA-binding LytR/AlgR family response regulator